jgi:hypothetical protein
MKLRYHQATFDMLTQTPIDTTRHLHALAEYEVALGLAPDKNRRLWTTMPLYHHEAQFSESNVLLLDTFENKYGVKLPASMREWYSLDIGLPMLWVDGAWWPVQLSDLGNPDRIIRGEIQLLDHNLLVFMEEQQAGDWCVRLKDHDDPPVYWLMEGSDLEKHPPDIRLQKDAPRFSDFIYCFLWDWLAAYRSEYWFSISSTRVIPRLRLEPEYYIPLAFLYPQFHEIQQQAFHGHRFFSKTQRFCMHTAPDDPSRVGEGYFGADSAQALQDLIWRIWGNSPPLRKMNTWHPESRQVLENLKRAT